ncbi:hypothetical protein GCM10023142_16690 [Anaerocolumna aminovalerica]|uniref:Diguanylate cyclase (GGDEF) domain-containing protein n=1 Tax=Anaerocolumna aminovalerica TaxID=1527 RepID=A0A1I5C599_9FIRM|nr:EAL domain-containing protein [Anaerocolumna aminovalerica]SFN82250.1 diguanylate cyclase (GGDEF) domain-containing protein [Anaerocolumna aminovalerica]
MSIKNTFRKTLILFSIVPIIIVSVVAYYFITRKLISVTTDNLQQLAETNSNGLDALIETQRTEVDLLSIQNELYHFTSLSNTSSLINTSFFMDAYKDAYDLLQQRNKLNPSCERITVYNAGKEVVACSKEEYVGLDASDNLTLYYIGATGRTAYGVSGLIKHVDKNNKIDYYIEIGSPILGKSSDDLPIIGYVVNTISISYFDDFLKSIEMGDTGFGQILDKGGKIIYHPNSDLIGKDVNSEKLSNIINNYYSGTISKSGAFNLYHNGSEKGYGYSVIPKLNWVLVVQQDVSEMIDLANIIIYVLALTMIVLMIVVIAVSSSISKAFTDPIIELKDVMMAAAEGNLEIQSNIRLKNELGELSRIFNKMIHIIRGNYNDLSAMHEELLTNEEELRVNYEHIEYLAYHDVLTKLPNKMSFIEKVSKILDASAETEQIHAIYFVDLDNFKTINDTLGHDYGDQLLEQTAEQLINLAGPNDIVARAGGDEFLLFRKNLQSREDAGDFAAKVISSFKDPFNLNGEIAHISMSMGIALYPNNGVHINALIKNADIAMYRSKDTGKNKFTMFCRNMEEELSRNAQILEILRSAISSKEVYVKYQPQYNISTNTITGFEALMRINNSKLGNISPAEFIPIAEESGLIIGLGEWILREACTFNKSLLDQGFTPCIVSVNISTVQINHPDFVSMVDSVLKETNLPPQYLELEITESTLVSSLIDATILLSNLQNLGVHVSLDDFGTGYSSLNYLTTIPINTLKIDKSFVDNISKNDKDACIADAIIQLAHSIQVDVIAEGVEHEEQLIVLKKKNCDIVQGYIFSKPLLPSALINLLKNT